MFQIIIIRENQNQPMLVEFMETTNYTYWHYHGNAEVFSTGQIIRPFSDELAKFCHDMKWKFVAKVE